MLMDETLETFKEHTDVNRKTKLDHENKFGDFFQRISNNFDNVKTLKQRNTEQKDYNDMIIAKTEGIRSRIDKIRDNIVAEMQKLKEEIHLKIDDVDKYAID
jgi:radical SAM superfamily enzyme